MYSGGQMSRAAPGKRIGVGDAANKGKLLQEIEALNQNIYLHKKPSKGSGLSAGDRSNSLGSVPIVESDARSKQGDDGSHNKDKKSFWNWKALKVLSHVRNRRFNCCFTLHVHRIEGLPPDFNGLSICVHWKRREGDVVTSPVKVIKGVAEFEERLTYTCSVYGSRSGSHHSAKYEAKLFLLYAAVCGNSELDLGKHRVDLTRLLPLTLEDLEDEKSSGKWNTTYKLLGKARGAVMNVSFGYLVLGDNHAPAPNNKRVLELLSSRKNRPSGARSGVKADHGDEKGSVSRAGSLPSQVQRSLVSSRSTKDIEVLEVFPVTKFELSDSLKVLDEKFDQELETAVDKSELDVPSLHTEESFNQSDPWNQSSSPLPDSYKEILQKEAEGIPSSESFDQHDVWNPSSSPLPDSFEEILQKEDESRPSSETFDRHDVWNPLSSPLPDSYEEILQNEDEGRPSSKSFDRHDVWNPSSSPLPETYEEILQKEDEGRPSSESFDRHDVWNPSSSPPPDSYEEILQKEDEGRPSLAADVVVDSSVDDLVDDSEKLVHRSTFESTGSIAVVDDDVGVKETKCYEEDREPNKVRDDILMHDTEFDAKDLGTKEALLKELESALNDVADLENAAVETPRAKSEQGDQEDDFEDKSSLMDMPCNLEDFAESVEIEFLNMLGVDDSPSVLSYEEELESPRERLLRDFEKENNACCLFDFDVYGLDEEECGYNAPRVPEEWLEDDFEIPSTSWDDENHQFDSRGGTFRPRARVLEDLETEALMQEWGLDENAFKNSPPESSAGFSSPIDLPPAETEDLPPLGEGLGPFVQTNNGGFLRSMNPSLFKNAKSGGNLIMQVSSPVVVPAKMGSGVSEILQHLASIGLEKLSMQAHKLMPLEDITGKTMEQIAWESTPKLEGFQREDLLQLESESPHPSLSRHKRAKGKSSKRRSNKRNPRLHKDQMKSEYVSLEDLAPLAMENIEALSIEGLRMQSGMSEELPSNRSQLTIGEFPVLEAGSTGIEGAVGLQLLDLQGNRDEAEGLMDLSITLEEWMRLDAGEVDEDQMSERTSRILVAHHATSTDINFVGKQEDKQGKGKGSSKRCGLMGNNFTVALMVQLRDPSRNYEPVGTPMLALIQVERVFIPPKPRIYSTVSLVRTLNEDDEDYELVAKVKPKQEKKEEKTQEEVVPQYRIADVHLAGLKTEAGKKKMWGGKIQVQSSSRWLIANGMGKSNKHPLMKARVVTKSSLPAAGKAEAGDSLWSISAKGK